MHNDVLVAGYDSIIWEVSSDDRVEDPDSSVLSCMLRRGRAQCSSEVIHKDSPLAVRMFRRLSELRG